MVVLSRLHKQNIQDISEATSVQENIYQACMQDPLTPDHIGQLTYRLNGRFDSACVEQSLNVLIGRHNLLRTVFNYRPSGTLLQVVLKAQDIDYTLHSLRRAAYGNVKQQLLSALQLADAERPFDLHAGPLLRLMLVELDPDCSEFIWTYHTLILDQESMLTLTGEYMEIYERLKAKFTRYPVSHGQHGLFIKRIYASELIPFNMTKVFEVNDIDLDVLRDTFKYLLQRHENLRTVFVPTEEGLQYRLLDEEADIYTIDFTDLEPLTEEEARRALQAYKAYPFDLENELLVKVGVFRKREDSYLVVLVIDHILSDAWSLQLLTKELGYVYGKIISEKQIDLDPLVVKFSDYVAAQQQMLAGAAGKKHLDYWSRVLAKPLPLTSLTGGADTAVIHYYRQCLDGEIAQFFKPLPEEIRQIVYGTIFKARPNVGRAYRSYIPPATLAAVRNLAAGENVSTFSVLLAALNLLLIRRGQQDTIIGTPVSLRESAGTNALIGWFLNTLLIRTKVQPQVTVAVLLQQVAKNVLQTLDHRFYPMELLMDQLDLSYDVIGKVFLHLLSFETTALSLPPFAATHMATGTPTFDINFTFTEYADGMELVCDYRPECFTEAAITAITLELITLLAALPGMLQQQLPHPSL